MRFIIASCFFSVCSADFLFATGGRIQSVLYRISDAGTGTVETLGTLQITNVPSATAFAIVGLAFDYNPITRPNGALFALTSADSGIVSSSILQIDNPYALSPSSIVNAELIAQTYAPATGLAISGEQEMVSWLVDGGGGGMSQDELISINAGPSFPRPARFGIHSGVRTDGNLVGFDFRRDENQNDILHMIFFNSDNSPFHSYIAMDLDTGRASAIHNAVTLSDVSSRCFGGSINPNIDGEFWCIQKPSMPRMFFQTLIKIDLEAGVEVGRQILRVRDLSAIAFSYDTTQMPSSSPSSTPSLFPSAAPTSIPTTMPSSEPSLVPTSTPSLVPTAAPSESPSMIPSEVPSAKPSASPSGSPSANPTAMPSNVPTGVPSSMPTSTPSSEPSSLPSRAPTSEPSSVPSQAPTNVDSAAPSLSNEPSEAPTSIPSEEPSAKPTVTGSEQPSELPTSLPSVVPTSLPSVVPSVVPTSIPSVVPTLSAMPSTSMAPSAVPTISSAPTTSRAPSRLPSSVPSQTPSAQPSSLPSATPSLRPSVRPSANPTV